MKKITLRPSIFWRHACRTKRARMYLVRSMKAFCLRQSERYSEEEAACRSWLQLSPDSPDATINSAVASTRKKIMKGRLRRLATLLNSPPTIVPCCGTRLKRWYCWGVTRKVTKSEPGCRQSPQPSHARIYLLGTPRKRHGQISLTTSAKQREWTISSIIGVVETRRGYKLATSFIFFAKVKVQGELLVWAQWCQECGRKPIGTSMMQRVGRKHCSSMWSGKHYSTPIFNLHWIGAFA